MEPVIYRDDLQSISLNARLPIIKYLHFQVFQLKKENELLKTIPVRAIKQGYRP